MTKNFFSFVALTRTIPKKSEGFGYNCLQNSFFLVFFPLFPV